MRKIFLSFLLLPLSAIAAPSAAVLVGGQPISEQDVALRAEWCAVMHETKTAEASRQCAIASLVEGKLYQLVLSELGAKKAADKAFAAYAAERAKAAPEASKLALLQKIFGKDTKAFQRVGLAPEFYNSYFNYTYFPERSWQLTAPVRAKVEKAHALASKGMSMQEASRVVGVDYRKELFSPDTGVRPYEESPQPLTMAELKAAAEQTQSPVNVALADEVKTVPANTPGSFLGSDESLFFISWSAKVDGRYIIETVSAPRLASTEWFAEKIKLQKVVVPSRKDRGLLSSNGWLKPLIASEK